MFLLKTSFKNKNNDETSNYLFSWLHPPEIRVQWIPLDSTYDAFAKGILRKESFQV
jgi:hypothetical protein